MLVFFMSAALASGTWRVDVSPVMLSGEPIAVVVSVTNNTDSDVLLPADALSRLAITAEYRHPNERKGAQGQGYAKPTPVPASTVTWTTLAPGARLTRSEELGPPEGVHVGRYLVSVRGEPRRFSDPPEGADNTLMNDTRSVLVESDARDVYEHNRTASVRSARVENGQLHLEVVVRNLGEAPLWVPSTYLEHCDAQALHRDGSRTGFTTGMGTGGQPHVMDEPMLTLLEQWEEQRVDVSCGTIPPKARAVAATVTLVPQAPLVPVLPRSPRTVLGGPLPVDTYLVDPRRLPGG